MQLVWMALALASMPILLDLADHMLERSWTWYALVFPPLAWLAIREAQSGAPRAPAAWMFVLLGLVAQGWALASGQPRHGRLGVVLAVIGVLELQGRPSPRAWPLLVLCVPIPRALLVKAAEPVSSWIAHGVAQLDRWRGIPSIVRGAQIELPSGVLSIEPSDPGWQLGLLAFGLAWFGTQRARCSPMRSLGLSTVAGAVAVLLHMGATTVLLAMIDPLRAASARTARDVMAVALALFVAWLCFGRSGLGSRSPRPETLELSP
jgi:hypothetical protein